MYIITKIKEMLRGMRVSVFNLIIRKLMFKKIFNLKQNKGTIIIGINKYY